MSYELNIELSQVLVHMENVLDLRTDRSYALTLITGSMSNLNSQRVELDSCISELERLEDDVEQIAEQVP